MHHNKNMSLSISNFSGYGKFSLDLTVRDINSIDDSFISFKTSSNKYVIIAECFNASLNSNDIANVVNSDDKYIYICDYLKIEKDFLLFLFEKRGYYTFNISILDKMITIILYKSSEFLTQTNIKLSMLNMKYKSTLAFGSTNKDFSDDMSYRYFSDNLIFEEYHTCI